MESMYGGAGQGRTAAAPVLAFCTGGGGIADSPAAARSLLYFCHHGPAERSSSSLKIVDDHFPSMSNLCVVPFSDTGRGRGGRGEESGEFY